MHILQRQDVIRRKEEAAKQQAWGEAGLIINDLKAALADTQQQLREELGALGAFAAAGKELPCLVETGGNDEVLKAVEDGKIYASVALQFEEDMKQSFMRSVCAINLEVS